MGSVYNGTNLSMLLGGECSNFAYTNYLAESILCIPAPCLCKYRLIVPRCVVTFESLFNVITVAAFCSQLKGCMLLQHIPLDGIT